MAAPHFLVRHGQADYDTDSLTKRGRQDAEFATRTLLSLPIGNVAMVLSSDAGRAVQTAAIIATDLRLPLVESNLMYLGGNQPRMIADLDDFIAKSVREGGQEYDPSRSLIIVTHSSLLAVAKGLAPNDVGGIKNGDVVTYQPDTWNAAYYNPAIAARYLPSGP